MPENNWEEAKAFTGRPNDIPVREPEDAPLDGNSTFSTRAKRNRRPITKAVSPSGAENKAVKRAARK